jgi:hypothetical protein
MGSYSGGIVPSAGAELQAIRARPRPTEGPVERPPWNLHPPFSGFNRHTTRLALRVRAIIPFCHPQRGWVRRRSFVSIAGTPAASDARDKHARDSSQTRGGVVATLAITNVGLCARPQVPTQLGSSGCRVCSRIEGHVHRRPL